MPRYTLVIDRADKAKEAPRPFTAGTDGDALVSAHLRMGDYTPDDTAVVLTASGDVVDRTVLRGR